MRNKVVSVLALSVALTLVGSPSYADARSERDARDDVAIREAPAHATHTARTLGCATHGEFLRVRRGMTPARVAVILGTYGRLEGYYGYYAMNRLYRTCRQSAFAGITFSRASGVWRVYSKQSYWA